MKNRSFETSKPGIQIQLFFALADLFIDTRFDEHLFAYTDWQPERTASLYGWY
jgi:hypothetical protein